MAYELNRRRVSAIAKLDFSGKSHCQRLDMVARALGARNHAALMAGLAMEEDPIPPQAGAPAQQGITMRVVAVLRERDPNEGTPCFLVLIRRHFDELRAGVARSWHEDETVAVVSPEMADRLMSSGAGFRKQVGAEISFSERRDDRGLYPGERGPHGTVFHLDGRQSFYVPVGPDERLCDALGMGLGLPRPPSFPPFWEGAENGGDDDAGTDLNAHPEDVSGNPGPDL